MFRLILVPTDGGAGSRAAVRFAGRLARVHRARLHAAYVLDRTLIQRALITHRDALRVELTAEARRALAQARATCRRLKVPYEESLVEGHVETQILHLARRARASLIVMHTAGRGRLATFVIGSTAQAILRRGPCPVLLMAERAGRPGHRRPPRA